MKCIIARQRVSCHARVYYIIGNVVVQSLQDFVPQIENNVMILTASLWGDIITQP